MSNEYIIRAKDVQLGSCVVKKIQDNSLLVQIGQRGTKVENQVTINIKSFGHWIKYIFQLFKMNLIPTVIMAIFWMVLGWVRSVGIQWAILYPLNFLTGALNGLDGNVIGGTMGKTLLLVMFNSMFRGILAKRGTFKERKTAFFKELKSEGISAILKKTIPQYNNLKMIFSKRTPEMFGCTIHGLALALFMYPFITGDGSLVNSMVCVALFFNIGRQLAKQRGFLISVTNMFLERKNRHVIDKDAVNRFFAGYTIGMAAAVAIAAGEQFSEYAGLLELLFVRILPWILFVLGFVGICWKKIKVDLLSKKTKEM